MRHIKFSLILLTIALVLIVYSCHKNEQASKPVQYLDPVAQDTSYRFGKWYSVTPWTNQSGSPYLDTIWFINDTMAGWTGFGGNPYVFWKTYFPDALHIAYIAPDPLVLGKIDTIINYCQMTTANSDTFQIWWQDGLNYTPQNYVKKTN